MARFDDNDRRLLPGSAEEQSTSTENESYFLETEGPEGADEYYELPAGAPTMLWSILSLLCSLLSIGLCFLYYVSLPIALLAVLFSVVSRKKLGFFDKKSVFGLIVGIFGIVFGLFGLVVDVTGVLDDLIV